MEKIDGTINVSTSKTTGDSKNVKIKNSNVNVVKCEHEQEKAKVKINKDGTVTINSAKPSELEKLARAIVKGIEELGEDAGEWRKMAVIMEELEEWK